MDRDTEKLKKMIDDRSLEVVRKWGSSSSFTNRKLTDTPTDALSVVNRKYVTLNGTTNSRPTSSILGQYYFDTTIGRPIWWNGSAWIKADGTVV
jgi:hypothetical protein